MKASTFEKRIKRKIIGRAIAPVVCQKMIMILASNRWNVTRFD